MSLEKRLGSPSSYIQQKILEAKVAIYIVMTNDPEKQKILDELKETIEKAVELADKLEQ